jgi:hypothetical protein
MDDESDYTTEMDEEEDDDEDEEEYDNETYSSQNNYINF